MDRHRKAADAQSNTTSIRVRKQAVAEQHKRRIMEAVNQLNDDELEKVSEMLRVSEAVNENEQPAEDDVNILDEANEEQDQVGEIEIANPVVRIAEDQASSVSQQMSQSSKVIVASLQQQLQEEQDARKKLEQELNNLQTVSSNIQKRLGSSVTK